MSHEVPPGCVVRQDVVRPARCLELLAHDCAFAAEVAEERVRRELARERRRRAVAGIDDRLGREALEQRAHGAEERLPVAAREIDAADRAREEQVAGEELAVVVERDVTRRSGRARRSPRRRSRRP